MIMLQSIATGMSDEGQVMRSRKVARPGSYRVTARKAECREAGDEGQYAG